MKDFILGVRSSKNIVRSHIFFGLVFPIVHGGPTTTGLGVRDIVGMHSMPIEISKTLQKP